MDATGTAELVAALPLPLPLAEAALRLLQRVTDAEPLNQLFDEHRGRGYERLLTFPQMVRLIGDALLEGEAAGIASSRALGRRVNCRRRWRPCTASWGG